MANYYKRKPGHLAITLLDGKTYTFTAKKMTEVPAALESSPRLLRYVKSGHLHKQIDLSFSKEPDIKEPAIDSQSKIEPSGAELPMDVKNDEMGSDGLEVSINEQPVKRKKKIKE